jgi:hypothetical protein
MNQKLLLALLLGLLFMQGVQAREEIGRATDALQAAGLPVKGVGLADNVFTIIWKDEATDEQKTQGEDILKAFNPLRPPPNTEKFVDAVIKDAAIPADIYPYIPVLKDASGDPRTLKDAWAKIEQTLGLSLNAQARAAIKAHAAAADMPVK